MRYKVDDVQLTGIVALGGSAETEPKADLQITGIDIQRRTLEV